MCVYFERGIRVAMFVSVTAKHRRLKLCVCGEGLGGCPIDGLQCNCFLIKDKPRRGPVPGERRGPQSQSK